MSRRGFSLLEIIVAMGVLAIGATAAFGLLVAATAAGRRAEHHVNAAVLAESLLNDLHGYPLGPNALEDLEVAELTAGDEAGSPQDTAADPSDPPGPAVAAAGPTRYLAQDLEREDFPGYVTDVTITPLEGPVPNEPWHFLVEVEVRWSERGKRRSAVFAKVMLRNASHLDRVTAAGP